MDDVEEHLIKTTRTARYYTRGNNDGKYLWIACHGYGERASNFIKNFEILGDEHLVIAPEGLSRFYKEGFYGDVVTSWMTKEMRLYEIEDHRVFLDQILNKFYDGKKKLILFGFSQGVATVLRWAANSAVIADAIVIYAGSMPPDIDYKNARHIKKGQVILAYGDKDKFINEEAVQQQLKMLEEGEVQYELARFEGKHRVYKEVLLKILEKIIKGK